jgi:hypothetical protein
MSTIRHRFRSAGNQSDLGHPSKTEAENPACRVSKDRHFVLPCEYNCSRASAGFVVRPTLLSLPWGKDWGKSRRQDRRYATRR